MTAVVLSHRTCSPDTAKVVEFLITSGDSQWVSPSFVPDWDDETPLEVVVSLDVDLERGLVECGLPPGSRLAGHLIWHATGSRLRGAGAAHEIEPGINRLSLQFSGSELGGTLIVRVVLTLLEAAPDSDALAPHRPGSLLWTYDTSVRLEGQGSRFPTSHVSFAETGLGGGLLGAWCLVFESKDLFDSGVGSLRLYLNSDHQAVMQYMADASTEPNLEPFLRNDVNRQLTLGALSHEDLDLEEEYPKDSLGELLALTIRRNFPNRTLDEIRALGREQPGEFEAHIQARGGYLL